MLIQCRMCNGSREFVVADDELYADRYEKDVQRQHEMIDTRLNRSNQREPEIPTRPWRWPPDFGASYLKRRDDDLAAISHSRGSNSACRFEQFRDGHLQNLCNLTVRRDERRPGRVIDATIG